MIIKMTVTDNDFTQEIERFCKNLISDLLFKTAPKEMSTEETSEFYIKQNKVLEILNPNITDKLTDEDKATVISAVFKQWYEYVDTHNFSERIKKYLKENFVCNLLQRFTDRWENGESVYYFTTNQKWIVQ